MRDKKILGYVMVAMLMVAVLALSCSSEPAEDLTPITIGTIVPTTGGYTAEGLSFRQAYELRFEQAGYEVAGRPLQLIMEDDASWDTAMALDKSQKMVEMDNASILISPLATPSVEAVAAYTEEIQIPLLAISCIEPSGAGWTFQTWGDTVERIATTTLGWYAYEMGYRTATTICSDIIAGHNFTGAFVEAFEERGGEVIQQQWPEIGAEDYAPYLVTLQEADVVMVWVAGGGDNLRFLTQYDEFGFFEKMPVVVPVACVLRDRDLQELGGGMVGDKILGICGAETYSWRLDNPANEEFVQAFEAKYGEKPDSFAAVAYEAASIAIAALEATGGDTTPETLRQAILDTDLEFPSGHFYFDAEGLAMRTGYVFEVQKIDGVYVWEPVREYPPTEVFGE